jgi:hypothetical protein
MPLQPLQPPQAAAAQPHAAPSYHTALQWPSAAAAAAPPAFAHSVAPTATAAAAAAAPSISSISAAAAAEEWEDEEEVPLAARRRKLAKTSSPSPQATIFGKPSAPSSQLPVAASQLPVAASQLAVAASQLQPGPAPPPSSGQYHDTPRPYPPGDPTAPFRHLPGDPTAPLRHLPGDPTAPFRHLPGDPTAPFRHLPGDPPMALHEACTRHAAGGLFEHGRARVLVRALSHLPSPSMHELTTTLSLPHRCVR